MLRVATSPSAIGPSNSLSASLSSFVIEDDPKEVEFDLNLFSSTSKTNYTKFNYDLRRDNTMVSAKVEPFLEELKELELLYNGFVSKNDMQSLLDLKDMSDSLMETCNSILNIYGIVLNQVTEIKKCSALHIIPHSNALTNFICLKHVMGVLMLFPFSFYYKLGINRLTLCDDITLLKEEHKDIYKKRLLNGLLPTKKVTTQEGVTRYLLLMIIYYMNQKIPQIHKEWISSYWPSYKKKWNEFSTTILEDQQKALNYLLFKSRENRARLESRDPLIKTKARKMSSFLKVIDSEMIIDS